MIIKLLGLEGYSNYTGCDLTKGKIYEVSISKEGTKDQFDEVALADTINFFEDDKGDKATTHVQETQFEVISE